MATYHGTTILAVRHQGGAAIGGDGQVTLGAVVMKSDAHKIRRLYGNRVVVGFAGASADAFALLERFEAKLKDFQGSVPRAATELAKKSRPDLLLDGPLQYYAAFIPEVARSKAPNSPVAGRATVFIFPDLNTGNTTYKAVQRSANVVSIGPMLQGLRRPVNDLSRGALVDDIVYTIALTAIQATQG